jgi:hypothetical protein
MVSLTTVYIMSVVLASIAGMGSAFAGKKIIGGAAEVPLPPQPVVPLPSIDETELLESSEPR